MDFVLKRIHLLIVECALYNYYGYFWLARFNQLVTIIGNWFVFHSRMFHHDWIVWLALIIMNVHFIIKSKDEWIIEFDFNLNKNTTISCKNFSTDLDIISHTYCLWPGLTQETFYSVREYLVGQYPVAVRSIKHVGT